MDVATIKSISDILAKISPDVLGMLLIMIAFTLVWLSWIVTSHLRNKEISRLIEAVNHNTNSVNLLLELTKLIFGAKFPKITNNKGDIASDGCICEELVGDIQKTQKDVTDIM